MFVPAVRAVPGVQRLVGRSGQHVAVLVPTAVEPHHTGCSTPPRPAARTAARRRPATGRWMSDRWIPVSRSTTVRATATPPPTSARAATADTPSSTRRRSRRPGLGARRCAAGRGACCGPSGSSGSVGAALYGRARQGAGDLLGPGLHSSTASAVARGTARFRHTGGPSRIRSRWRLARWSRASRPDDRRRRRHPLRRPADLRARARRRAGGTGRGRRLARGRRQSSPRPSPGPPTTRTSSASRRRSPAGTSSVRSAAPAPAPSAATASTSPPRSSPSRARVGSRVGSATRRTGRDPTGAGLEARPRPPRR